MNFLNPMQLDHLTVFLHLHRAQFSALTEPELKGVEIRCFESKKSEENPTAAVRCI